MITKDQFVRYEECRLNGATNMFDIRRVSEITGLDKQQIKEIMLNYGSLAEKYLNEGGENL